MTAREIQDLLSENFIHGEVDTSEAGFIRVKSTTVVPEGLQNRIRQRTAAHLKVSFMTESRAKQPVPKTLETWLKNTTGGKF